MQAGHLTAHATASQEYAAHDVTLQPPAAPPALGRTAAQLFAHGLPTDPAQYTGSCAEFAFTDPRLRQQGASSPNRATRVLWTGSKHNDKTVPAGPPVPRTGLLEHKRAQWARNAPTGQAATIGLAGTTTGEFGAALQAGGALLASRQMLPAGGRTDGAPAAAAGSFGRKSVFRKDASGQHLVRT